MRFDDSIFNIIFDAGKGTLSVSGREARCGQALGELPVPKRKGYTFEGWYLGDTLVTAETVPSEAEDMRLSAHWAKSGEKKPFSMLDRQWLVAIILGVVIVFLSITLAVVNRIVTVFPMTDTWVDSDGTEYSDRYYVKKKNGSYRLYTSDGTLCDQNEKGYYVLTGRSENQYKVDSETGDCELYAVVDYDAEKGESAGVGNRVMMFPQIEQKNVYSIEVTNEYGTYRFYRDESGTVKIEGVTSATYDPEKYASLVVSTGYMLTMMKIDLTSDEVAKDSDGNVDYAAFGLDDGNTSAIYTITKASFDANGKCSAMTGEGSSYTVKVGDKILSGGGYYVQLVGRDAVYVVASSLEETLLQPKEELVTPQIVYPLSLSTYLMVYDFMLAKVDLTKEGDDSVVDLIAAFDYQNLEERENTMLSNIPFVSNASLMSGYYLNSDTVSEALGNLYDLQIEHCVALGLTQENLQKYHLDGEAHLLSYVYEVTDDTTGESVYVTNNILISPKTENGTYYIASKLYDMIVEVDQYYFAFLEWDKSDWYASSFFQTNIIYCSEMHLESSGKSYDFYLDNRWSYAYYWNADSGAYKVISLDSGVVYENDGKYYYAYKNDSGNRVDALIFFINDTVNGYVKKGNSDYMYYFNDAYIQSILSVTDTSEIRAKKEAGIQIQLGTWNVIVSSPQYTGATDARNYVSEDGKSIAVTYDLYKYLQVNGSTSDNSLDYVLSYEYLSDAAKMKTKEVTAVKNFRSFYTALLYFSIEGEINEKEFRQYMGESVSEFLSHATDADCQAKLFYKSKDNATLTNNYCNENGLNYQRDCIVRFYQYAPGKSMITVELITGYNADGTPITDPSGQQGVFYVLSSYVEKLVNDAERLLNETEIASDSKS